MLRLFTGSTIFYSGKFVDRDFLIDNSSNFYFYNESKHSNLKFDEIIDCNGLHVFPGFIDPHIHLREPGFEYKDTIATSTLSAAAGGYTTVFAMPNLNPVPDTVENLQVEKNLIDKNSVINVIPVCAITKGQTGRGELSDIESLIQDNKLFSDDGKGIQDENTMRAAMQKINAGCGYVLAHCEDEAELCGGSLNKGEVANKFGDLGINNASEYNQVIRDIKLAKETGCKYHVCHVSTIESVNAIRQNKCENITGEATVHHLFLNETNINEDNGKWKMNPPLRTEKDQIALQDAVLDETINMICTDNAPHAKNEKDCKIKDAAMGIVSIEAAFSLFYTYMVKSGAIKLENAIKLFSTNAAEFFKIEGGKINEGKTANLCFYDLNRQWTVDSSKFKTLGKSCPFDGAEVYGKCKMTVCNGQMVYREKG